MRSKILRRRTTQACLCSRLVPGSTRSHHTRQPVGLGVWPSASSPEAARPSPQEATPPPSAPRALPEATMVLRVRVGVRVCVCMCLLAMCGTMCACLCVYYVGTDVSFCCFLVHLLLSKKIFQNGIIIFEGMDIFCRFDKLPVICVIDAIDKQINYLFQINNHLYYLLNRIFS